MAVDFKNTRVLVIDDEGYIRRLICKSLRQLDILNIYEAEEGQYGLQQVVRVRPHLVLCDIHMEPVDGLTFLRKLRAAKLESIRNTPVVFLTGDSHIDTVVKARDLEPNGYMVKPVSVTDLRQRIQSVLDK
ncbi:response regulator [Alphaproteobacteria bacterium HT1-32]|nr:response regulator [Alphaproteobacteria bacterium HT1-32]